MYREKNMKIFQNDEERKFDVCLSCNHPLGHIKHQPLIILIYYSVLKLSSVACEVLWSIQRQALNKEK